MRLTSRLVASFVIMAGVSGSLPALLGAADARAQTGAPHGWLFGSWTGGLFPVPSNLAAQACLQQPVVIFTRDVVLRASITEQLYGQRLIETARTSGNSTEFRFSPAPASGAATGLLGLGAPQPSVGFGCGDPNVLHVLRRSENEISFPGCSDFPNPLVRCQMR